MLDEWRRPWGGSTPIFHFTHIDNLASILAEGALLSDNWRAARGIRQKGVAHRHIKDRRAATPVPIGPGGMVADYVPFYFAPRSPMLYAIHKNNVADYTDGQDPLVYLVSSVERIVLAGLPFVFTDGHATMQYLSSYFDDPNDLTEVDWTIMRARIWRDTTDDNDRSRRRQAEFLVHQRFPVVHLRSFGTRTAQVASNVRQVLAANGIDAPVGVRRDWYYR